MSLCPSLGGTKDAQYYFQRGNSPRGSSIGIFMNLIFGVILGYIIHDAVQPTVVGKVLDKVSLPADLFVSEDQTTNG